MLSVHDYLSSGVLGNRLKPINVDFLPHFTRDCPKSAPFTNRSSFNASDKKLSSLLLAFDIAAPLDSCFIS